MELDKMVSDGREFGAKLTDLERENQSLNDELIQRIESCCKEMKEDQKQLETLFDSERALRKEQIDSECKSRSCEMEKFSERCKQLEETVEGLETLTAVLTDNFSAQTLEEQFESLLKPERKALQELISTEGLARGNENCELMELSESLSKRITEERSTREKQISDMSHRLTLGHTELNHLIGENNTLHTQTYRQLESRLESESKKCVAECNKRIDAAASHSKQEFSKLWSAVQP